MSSAFEGGFLTTELTRDLIREVPVQLFLMFIFVKAIPAALSLFKEEGKNQKKSIYLIPWKQSNLIVVLQNLLSKFKFISQYIKNMFFLQFFKHGKIHRKFTILAIFKYTI